MAAAVRPQSDPIPPRAVSGTTTAQREVVGDEYVRALADLSQRMQVYTRMRRGDGAVNTSLLAIEKPILAARWDVAGDDDIAEACREELFGTTRGDPWDAPLLEQALGHLAGMFQYGFAAAEPVWEVGEDGQVHCARLTLIRQESVRAFKLDAVGRLETLVQYSNAFEAGLREIPVPVAGLLLAVHQREGSDYSGVAIIRPSYRAWLERDTIRKTRLWHHDRFGAGTPAITMGEAASDTAMREAEEAAANFRSGSQTYLVVRGATKVEVVGGQISGDAHGELSALAAEIAKNTLSQLTEFGTSGNTGNRSLSTNVAAMLRATLQGYAEYLAALVSRQLLRPFVRFNFGEAAEVPELTTRVSLAGAAELLEMIAAAKEAGLELEPEDIAAIRDEIELPEIPLDELKQRMADRRAAAAAVLPSPASGGGAPSAKTPNEPGTRPATLAEGTAALPDTPARDLAPDFLGRLRPAHVVALEEAVLKPAAVGPMLDREALRAGADVHDVLRDIRRALVDTVEALAASDGALVPAELASIDVPPALVRRLRTALAKAAARAQRLGAETVRDELARQGFATTTLADDVFFGGLAALLKSFVGLAAVREAAALAQAAQAAALEAVTAMAAQAATTPGVVGSIAQRIAQRVADALAARSPAMVDARVSEVVNVAFGQGRRQAAQAARTQGGASIDRQIRSEALDANTCGHCADHDGDNFAFGDPSAPELPDPDCDGGFRCRGVWIYALASRQEAA